MRSSKIVERSTEVMNVQGNRIDQTVKKTWTVTQLDSDRARRSLSEFFEPLGGSCEDL